MSATLTAPVQHLSQHSLASTESEAPQHRFEVRMSASLHSVMIADAALVVSIDEQMLALQWEQLKHDESYHKDIVILPLAARLKHMALHNAKYTAHFLSAVHVGDSKLFEKTLLDAFVISLASANALNQNLGVAVTKAVGDAASLKEAGALLAKRLPRDGSDCLWLPRTFAEHNGKFAKACESLDHIEDDVPFKKWMKEANCSLFKVILAEASAQKIDLLPLYRSRMREIEAKSIFDNKYCSGAGGEA